MWDDWTIYGASIDLTIILIIIVYIKFIIVKSKGASMGYWAWVLPFDQPIRCLCQSGQHMGLTPSP